MEFWKTIPDYSDYQASTLGRIKSMGRVSLTKNGIPKPIKERILTPTKGGPGYLTVKLPKVSGGQITCNVHRLVARTFLGSSNGLDVDHINRDKSDNRLENLRYGTDCQNLNNTGPRSTNTSGYKGVSWVKSGNKWGARCVQPNGKYQYLGGFSDPKEAAKAYDEAAIRQYGTGACTNASMGLI